MSYHHRLICVLTAKLGHRKGKEEMEAFRWETLVLRLISFVVTLYQFSML